MNDSSLPLSADAQPHAGLHLRLISQAPVALDVTLDCAPGELIALLGVFRLVNMLMAALISAYFALWAHHR
ncbi:MAG: hypothetical protein HC858_09155, partial [Brachymonas sp.]|nr:hypothetical protein [Brachymonas sp.]